MPARTEILKIAADWGTVIVAAAALVVTAWTGYQGAKLNEKSVKIADDAQKEVEAENRRKSQPYLDFQYQFGTSEKNEGYLRLANVGVGVAKIVSVTATFDGDDIAEKGSLDGSSLAKAAKVLPDGDFIEARNLKIDQVIEGGGKVTILQIAESSPTDATLRCNRTYERKKLFASKLRITVTYKAADYKEEPRTTTFEYLDPPRSGCRPRKDSPFSRA